MLKQHIDALLQKMLNNWDKIRRNRFKKPHIAAIISHTSNTWALNTIRGAQAYYRTSNIPLAEQPLFEFFFAAEEAPSNGLFSQSFEVLKTRAAEFDAIVAVGATASLEAKSFLTHHKIPLSLYCVGVQNPVDLNLVSTCDTGRSEDIGVIAGHGYQHERQVETFIALNPHIRKVTLLYYNDMLSEQMVGDDVKRVQKSFELANIEVTIKRVSIQENLFKMQINELVAWPDAICTFRDIQYKNGINTLITACNDNDTLLFTSELASVCAGAGIGYGSTGFEYGEKIGIMTADKIFSGISPANLPVAQVYEPGTLKVNNAVLGTQGLHLDKRTLRLVGETQLLY